MRLGTPTVRRRQLTVAAATLLALRSAIASALGMDTAHVLVTSASATSVVAVTVLTGLGGAGSPTAASVISTVAAPSFASAVNAAPGLGVSVIDLSPPAITAVVVAAPPPSPPPAAPLVIAPGRILLAYQASISISGGHVADPNGYAAFLPAGDSLDLLAIGKGIQHREKAFARDGEST